MIILAATGGDVHRVCEENSVAGQYDCHPEQAAFAQQRIWASRAKRRIRCDATIARSARFPLPN